MVGMTDQEVKGSYKWKSVAMNSGYQVNPIKVKLVCVYQFQEDFKRGLLGTSKSYKKGANV